MTYVLRKAVSAVLPTWISVGRRPDFSLMRAHERHSCCAVACLQIIERDIELEGLVLEVSLGGLMFREASRYIYDRRGAAIRVRVGGLDLAGMIVNVRAQGYGIKLSRLLDPYELDLILTHATSRSAEDKADHVET
jgi:hypothetical protein